MTHSSPVLRALYRGDPDEARAAAEERELDIFEAAALGRRSRVEAAIADAPELARAGAEDGFTALHLVAFFNGDPRVARVLLDAGTDPDVVAANGTQLRPINSAAAAGSDEIVALLIERGADVDAQQRGGYTALHSAAANGNQGLARLLIEAGADAARRTDDGKSAATLARERGHPEIARWIEDVEARASDRS